MNFSKKGSFEAAEKLDTQVLNLHLKLLGPEHPNTLLNMNNLAVAFSNKENLRRLRS